MSIPYKEGINRSKQNGWRYLEDASSPKKPSNAVSLPFFFWGGGEVETMPQFSLHVFEAMYIYQENGSFMFD